MNVRSIAVKIILAGLLAVAGPWLHAQDGLQGAISRANLASPLERTLAAADFDNDNKPDGAVLVDSGWLRPQSTFQIELHFTARKNAKITFDSPETALTLAAWDINHDGQVDIIVEQAFTHRRLHVWLNDGRGDFHEAPIQDFPFAASGTGERLESPSPAPDCPAICLPSQRGSELALRTARDLSGYVPSTGGFEAATITFSPVSGAFSPDSSRAPPPPY